MSQPYILALDIGTSSTRAMLFDATAQVVPGCVAQVATQMQTTGDGGATFDAPALLATVVTAIDQLLSQAGSHAAHIGGVTCATFVGNVLGTDASGTVLTPIYTYADTRNAADADTLRRELGPNGRAAGHERTGTLIHTSYLPARLRWLHRIQPTTLAAVRYWLSFGEYLLWQLTGQRVVSYSVAAWTGLLNRHSLRWDAEWLAQLPVSEEQLSPLVDVDQPVTGLLPAWAQRWPALRNVPWFPAIGDGAAANLGSGCDQPNRVALTIGSTGALRVIIPPTLAQMPAGLWLYRVDRSRGLLGGATTEGGNLYAWLRETLQLPAIGEVEQALTGLPPAAHGLTLLPFVAGERAPGWNDSARATLHGFSLNTRPMEIVQAALEAIAYRFAIIHERVAPYLPPAEEYQIIASGAGLLSSPAWMQLMADVLGQPLVSLLEREITSRGIALLGLEKLGVIAQASALPPTTGETYLPNPAHHAVHITARAQQVALYDQLYPQ